MPNARPWVMAALALGGPWGCKPGVSPDALPRAPRVTAQVETCRGESLDLSPDGRRIVVTCRSREAMVVEVDPARPDAPGPVHRIPDVGVAEGIRFHPSGDFALLATFAAKACPEPVAGPDCKTPFDSEVVVLGLPRPGRGAPRVLARWPLRRGEDTCLAGEDVGVSADGRVAAVICNRPPRVFVYDVDPASTRFGAVTAVADIPVPAGRRTWLDEVVVSPDGQRAYVSDIDLAAFERGLVHEVSTADGAVRPPVYDAQAVAGLHLDPTGRFLYATVWNHGAVRVDLAAPRGDEDGRMLLRYREGMSYDLTTDADVSGTWAFAVTQYPGRFQIYDFGGRRFAEIDLPSRTANMPTSTVPARDRSRVYVQVETGALHVIDPGVPPAKTLVARFALEEPCAAETALVWDARGAAQVEIEGLGAVPAAGRRPVTAARTRRWTLRATYPRGVVRAAAVQWRPDHPFTATLCGATAPATRPATRPAAGPN